MISSRPPKRDLQEASAILSIEEGALRRLADIPALAQLSEKEQKLAVQRRQKAERIAGVIAWIEAQHG